MRAYLAACCAVLVALLAFSLPATAQETTATIVGTVSDDTGAVLPGVSIVAKHVATGRTFEFVSTATGAYTATLLPVGDVRHHVHPGWLPAAHGERHRLERQ